jgi:hypothetical protein
VDEADLFDEDNDVVGASTQGPIIEEDVDHEGHRDNGDE